MTGDTKEYPRIVVGSLITNDKGEILLTTSRKWGGLWTCQGGHLETGETLEQCARREIKEETNLDVRDLELVCIQDAISPSNYHKNVHMVFIDYSCRALNPEKIALNHELQEFRWVRPEDALGMNLNKSTRKFIEELIRKGG
jgi:ADP-ribose pyrophosphatase YjhB (NUDIX family)